MLFHAKFSEIMSFTTVYIYIFSFILGFFMSMKRKLEDDHLDLVSLKSRKNEETELEEGFVMFLHSEVAEIFS